jgi:hypothetical protein
MWFIYKTFVDEKGKKKRGLGCRGNRKVAEMPATVAGMSSVTQGQLIRERRFSLINLD